MYPGRANDPNQQVRLNGEDYNALRNLGGEFGRSEQGPGERNGAASYTETGQRGQLADVDVVILGTTASAFGTPTSGSSSGPSLPDSPPCCYYGYVAEQTTVHIDLSDASRPVRTIGLDADATTQIRRVLFVDEGGQYVTGHSQTYYAGLIGRISLAAASWPPPSKTIRS